MEIEESHNTNNDNLNINKNELSIINNNNSLNPSFKVNNVFYGEILEVGTNCKLAVIDFPCVLGNSKKISNLETNMLTNYFNLEANQKMCLNNCSCM